MEPPTPGVTRTLTVLAVDPQKGTGSEPPVFVPEEVVAGRFRIVRPLGAGGMGQVFEVEDLDLGTVVALKVIGPQIHHREGAAELFRREVQMAQKVTHPNVCRIFDLVKHDPGSHGEEWGKRQGPILALTMELLEGETLASRIEHGGPLPWAEASRLLRQLAAALDAAHGAGVFHCDFKLSNVILTPGRAVVTDFGLARPALVDDSAPESLVRGTPGYLAPEVLEGGPPTAAADLYALGVVARAMLTGQGPGDRGAGEPSPGGPTLPSAVVSILERATHPDPAERFPDGAGLVSALQAVSPASPTGRRLRWAAAAAVAALLVGLGLGTSRDGSSSPEEIPAELHLENARKALRSADYAAGRAAAARAVWAAHLTDQPELETEAQLLVVSAHEAMGETALADEAMSEARVLLEAAGDRCGLARASLILRDTADSQRSPLPLAELPQIFEECGDGANEAVASARLARGLTAASPVEGDRLLRRAQELAQKSEDPQALAKVWNMAGSIFYGLEDLRASDAAFARAAEEARRAEDPYLLAGILSNRSRILGWLGRHEEEEEVLREAGSLARRIGNRYLLARILATAAGHRERKGDLKGAAEDLEEAYRLSLALGDPMLLTIALQQQARFHERQGRFEQALEARQRRLELGERMELPLETARERLAVARVLLKLGRVGEAEDLVREIQTRFPLAEDGDSTAIYSRIQEAQIHLHQGRPGEAARLLEATLPHLVTKEEVGLRRDVARLAVEVDRQLGEPRLEGLWRRLAAAPVEASPSPGELDRALQRRADLGRILWFQGDEEGARQHLEPLLRQAQESGRTALAHQLAAEAEALESWRDYWQW